MRTILILFLLLFTVTVKSQYHKAESFTFDAVYLSYQPVDFGLGIRVDYHLGLIRTYSSISYGDGNLYKAYNIRHHYKFTTGIRIPFKNYNNNQYCFTAGINYHKLGSVVINNVEWETKLFNPWSLELGISAYVWNNFAIGVRTDILRWEPCVDFGWFFK